VIDLARVPLEERELPRLYHELARLGARAEGKAVAWGFRSPEPEELVVLAARQGTIAIRDYLAALRGRASRRQASRDLTTAPFLVQVGATRGARYRLAAGRGLRSSARRRAAGP
jgi:hypothetical protein